MAGSLKSYYFASEGCAASYSSGLPVKKCLYDDPDMCPDPDTERWALRAYSDVEVNVVCAGASYLVDYKVTERENLRMLLDYGARVTTEFLQCFFSGDARQCLPSELAVYPRDVADLAVCNAHQLAARTANAVAALMSPVFGEIYDAAGVDPRNAAYTTAERYALIGPYQEFECKNRVTRTTCEADLGITQNLDAKFGGQMGRSPFVAVSPQHDSMERSSLESSLKGIRRGADFASPTTREYRRYISQKGTSTSFSQVRSATAIMGFPTDTRDFTEDRKKQVFTFTSALSIPDLTPYLTTQTWQLEFTISDFDGSPPLRAMYLGFGFSENFADIRIVNYGTPGAYLSINAGSEVRSANFDMTRYEGYPVTFEISSSASGFTFVVTSPNFPAMLVRFDSSTILWNVDPTVDSVVFGRIPSSPESEWAANTEFTLESAYLNGQILQRSGSPDWSDCTEDIQCSNPYAQCLKSNVYDGDIANGRCLTPAGCRWAAWVGCTAMEPACYADQTQYPLVHNLICQKPLPDPEPPFPMISGSFSDNDAKLDAFTFGLPGGVDILNQSFNIAFTIDAFQEKDQCQTVCDNSLAWGVVFSGGYVEMILYEYGTSQSQFRVQISGYSRKDSILFDTTGLDLQTVDFRVRFYPDSPETLELLVAPRGKPFFDVGLDLETAFSVDAPPGGERIVFGRSPSSSIWDDNDFTLSHLSVNDVLVSQFVDPPPPPPPDGTPPAPPSPPGPVTSGEMFVPVDTRAYPTFDLKIDAMQFKNTGLRDILASPSGWTLGFRCESFASA